MARKKAKALPPKMITVYAEILQETEDAILVRCDDEADGVWLPKSQIKYSGERGDIGVEIQLPDWLGDEKGFFDGMGQAAAPAEPAPEPLPEPKHTCETCLHMHTGTVICDNCLHEAGGENDADSVDNWKPANDEPRCETCVHDESTDDTSCESCLDNKLSSWAPVHPCFAPPAAETADDKRAFGDNVKWLKEESITVAQPLSESEKAHYADEISALDMEIEALKDERADISNRLKKQIDAKEEERIGLSRIISTGEERTFTCDCLKDYNTGEMVWTEAYPPYNEVQRRKMTKEEMQPTLLEYPDKQGAAVPAGQDSLTESPDAGAGAEEGTATEAAPAEQERTCATCRHAIDSDDDYCDAPECVPDGQGNPSGWEAKPEKPCASDDLSNFTSGAAEPQSQEVSAEAV